MAAQDKVMLMSDVESTLKPRMFANLLDEAMGEINEHLDGYDIRHLGEMEKSDDLLESYINAKRVEGKSENTLMRYRYIIGKFMKYANVNARKVNTEHVRNYLASEQARGIRDTTVNGLRECLNSYFSWLEDERKIIINPVKNIGRIKCQKRVRDAFSESDIEKLKRACGNIRDYAILNFLLSTGCRISEVTQLNRDDVDLDNMECTVLGKGNKERVVYLSEVAAVMLREYLASRTDNNNALFIGQRGRLKPCGVRFMLNELAKKSNVENVHPHRFRRTMITNLLNRGMAIQDVCVVAGHERIDTTMMYFAKNRNRIKNSYFKYTA